MKAEKCAGHVSHHVDCLPTNICSCQLPVGAGEEGCVARGTAASIAL